MIKNVTAAVFLLLLPVFAITGVSGCRTTTPADAFQETTGSIETVMADETAAESRESEPDEEQIENLPPGSLPVVPQFDQVKPDGGISKTLFAEETADTPAEKDILQDILAGSPALSENSWKDTPQEKQRAYHDAAKLYFERLTEKQKIAQHFISWLPRNFTIPELEKQIRSGIGGFIIYPWNFEDQQDLKNLTAELHRLALNFNAGIDLFICGDQEGGRVNTYRFEDMVRLPSQADWALMEDDWFAYCLGYINGRQFREIGFNMNFAPVLDLTALADSSIIGDRALGNDPEMVGNLGTAYIRGLQEAGIMAVAKHFPGHGVSRVDSHISLPVSNVTLNSLMERELIPFHYAMQNGVAGIMTAHILFPRIDRRWPVTLSRIFIQDLLKGYMKYDGLVISDGLSMGALANHYSIDETLERGFNAGVDILLIHNKYDVNELIYKTRMMMESGIISRDLIMEGTIKILEKKAEYGLLPLTAEKNMP